MASIRTGRVLVRNNKMFKKMTKYSDTMIALKLANSMKGKGKEKVAAVRALLRERHGLLNILGVYLETSIDQYRSGIIGINPIIGLPKVITKKRQRSYQKVNKSSATQKETKLQVDSCCESSSFENSIL